MSPEVAVVIGAALVLALIGASAVVLVERYLRERGEVRCVVYDWELAFLEAGPPGHRAVFSFEVYLFNEDPSWTSLRDASVAFFRDGAREVVVRLRDSSSGEYPTLELPPQQGVHASLYAVLGSEEAREVADFRWVDFVGRLPDGKTFERKIAEQANFLASRKKAGARRKDFVVSRKKAGARRKDFLASRKRDGARRKDYRVRP